jgi:hypothetical protein
VIDEEGVFVVDALGHNLYAGQSDLTDEIAKEMVYSILARSVRIKKIRPSDFAPQITQYLAKLQKAVDAVEAIVLNPYTGMGRKRLMREFELIITDNTDT